MEDRLQICQARVKEDSDFAVSEAVFYEVKRNSIIFLGSQGAELLAADELKDSDMKDLPQADDYYSSEGDSVALLNSKSHQDQSRKSCCMFFMSYRSPNPDLNVTPFAVVMLLVLFVIYVLNQADRLMLPVAIPSGLRCEVSVKDECRNSSNVAINISSNETDCIHFSDNEQGLLTGMQVELGLSIIVTKMWCKLF